jgi:hypothetical protein
MRIHKISEKVVDVLLKIGIEILKILKKVNTKKGGDRDNTDNTT